MRLSRRTVLKSAAVAGAAAVTTPFLARAAGAASAPGDVVGKITVGYQGWFACIGDGAPINAWWHWSQNWSQPPSPTNNGTLRAWPDMREYPKGYQTAYANLGNGQPATLFSSYDQATVNLHFQWMQQNNIDTAALQRFNPNGGEGATRDAVASRVRSAAEAYGRKFYVMYDVSNWTAMQSEIKADWTSKMSAHAASSAYARQQGRPVVGIWGFGFDDPNHPWDAAACLDVINWFKGQGCYVMGGVPRGWRTATAGSRAGYLGVYHAFNMLSPWMVGAIGTIAEADNAYANLTLPDLADCNANGVDYQPCVLPGDVSARQRVHGDFMWRQFYNMVRGGVQSIYISMYDEFNEGNQIVKTAESSAYLPANSGLLGLNEDGTACSSDYYLRLTGDGGRMLKGQIALTATRPTAPVLGNPSTTVISLRSRANNLYVCADNAGASPLIANRTTIGAWEQFDLLDAGGGNVALRAHANGQIVCADNAGVSPLIANRTAVGGWETFQLLRNADGTVSLRALADNNYVTAENAGAQALIANRASIGAWEKFDLIGA
ncbi:hypothetical protein [Paractinoplanes globisporus]|uniref:Lectin n=1 Tax=Paractinoplanes globisporus TaxID=113565 RepID=A0ABW6WB05_9ACTN|nr:hypothetical protein [Actinoplanes globisporus]